jgi:sigma-B regulation protein RsbU (phosphoserine phosphatase)
MATLEICTDANARQFFELTADETVVGRDQFCDIVLRNHTVSRQHARIVRSAEGFLIEDLSSLNGTYINGRRIEGRAPIKDQDRIHFYEVVTLFHAGAPPTGDTAAAATGQEVHALETVSVAEEPRGKIRSHARAVARQQELAKVDGPVPAEGDPGSQARFRAALKISADLQEGTDLDQILPKILDSLFAIFPQAARGYILLAEGSDGHLVPRAIKHRRSESGHSMTFGPISRKTALRVMSSGEAVLMSDEDDSSADMHQSVFEYQRLSMICAPLMGPSKRPLGILYLDTTDAKRSFTQLDLEVLVTVATIAGQEVETIAARKATWDVGTHQRQLATAKQVQLQFLPQRRPQIAGYQFYDYYQPADEVGGDYFGYILLADGRLALAVGDVAGKGVSAALLMAHFCSEVRYCLATSPTPAEAVTLLNQDLSAEMLNYHFVTFVLCVLDPIQHKITLVNAGHLPPLRRRGNKVEELGAGRGGLPLGCDRERGYEQIEFTLENGDAIVLFTDGISEAMNAQGKVYSTSRLREVLARVPGGVQPMAEGLLEDVRLHVRGRLPSDDICLVCFGRND